MRLSRLLPAAAAGLMLTVTAAVPPASADGDAALEVEVRPLPLDAGRPEVRTVGRLGYRGGLELRSRDPRFGGFSALLMDCVRNTLVAASDQGYWLRGRLVHDHAGGLSNITDVTIAAMRGPSGRSIAGKSLGDAEALAHGPGGGLVVAFEQVHRLWLYPPGSATPVELVPPPDLAAAPRNGGIEALTALEDGRLLAITEELKSGRGVAGWLRGPGPGWSAFSYVTSEGFRPTGAATLPGGDVLVVERRFPPIGARLRRVASGDLTPGAEVEGREIARLEGSLSVDNMEGVDACLAADGATRIHLISDDNFSPLQRTLLMMFELLE